MGVKSLLRLGYVAMVVQGLLSVFAPKKAIRCASVGLDPVFENVEELEPRDWYVEVTKIVGVGMLAAGLTGLLVTGAEKDGEQRARAEFEADSDTEPAASGDIDAEDDEDDDGGPVTVNIEDDE